MIDNRQEAHVARCMTDFFGESLPFGKVLAVHVGHIDHWYIISFYSIVRYELDDLAIHQLESDTLLSHSHCS